MNFGVPAERNVHLYKTRTLLLHLYTCTRQDLEMRVSSIRKQNACSDSNYRLILFRACCMLMPGIYCFLLDPLKKQNVRKFQWAILIDVKMQVIVCNSRCGDKAWVSLITWELSLGVSAAWNPMWQCLQARSNHDPPLGKINNVCL